MAQKKQLKEDIIVNKDFNLLTRSYQEHAIGQINFARNSVLSSREFSQDLSEIFSDVKISYNTRLLKKNAKTTIKKNGKDVWILITANNKLYGDLILRICRLFLEQVKNTNPGKVDLVIIGRQGKKFIDESNLKRPYKYFEVPDVNVSSVFLKDICSNLLSYENILMFYGKFNNLVSQIPVEAYLSGGEMPTSPKSQAGVDDSVNNIDKQKKEDYLFEPSVDEIFSFFEGQILSILLNQTVQEAQLARFASRINAMETAQNNIRRQLNILTKKDKALKSMEMNKKQLELLAGRALWTRK